MPQDSDAFAAYAFLDSHFSIGRHFYDQYPVENSARTGFYLRQSWQCVHWHQLELAMERSSLGDGTLLS